jgi:nucleoside phosphorylase
MVVTVGALRTELLFVPGPRRALGVGQGAATRLARWLADRRPDGVLVVGFCGGLRGHLTPGALVLADRVVGEAAAIPVGEELVERARAAVPGAEVGALITAAGLVGPREKAILGIEALGVDLESAPLARELSGWGIPFLVVRVVLDALWEELPRRGQAFLWVRRALACARRLGAAARALTPVLEGRG